MHFEAISKVRLKSMSKKKSNLEIILKTSLNHVFQIGRPLFLRTIRPISVIIKNRIYCWLNVCNLWELSRNVQGIVSTEISLNLAYPKQILSLITIGILFASDLIIGQGGTTIVKVCLNHFLILLFLSYFFLCFTFSFKNFKDINKVN